MPRWWHLPLAGLLAVAVAAAAAYALRPVPVPAAAPWRVERREAVLTAMDAAQMLGAQAVLTVDVQRRPDGVRSGDGKHIAGPVWAIVMDVALPGGGQAGGILRVGCVVHAVTGRLAGCHGGALDWLPQD